MQCLGQAQQTLQQLGARQRAYFQKGTTLTDILHWEGQACDSFGKHVYDKVSKVHTVAYPDVESKEKYMEVPEKDGYMLSVPLLVLVLCRLVEQERIRKGRLELAEIAKGMAQESERADAEPGHRKVRKELARSGNTVVKENFIKKKVIEHADRTPQYTPGGTAFALVINFVESLQEPLLTAKAQTGLMDLYNQYSWAAAGPDADAAHWLNALRSWAGTSKRRCYVRKLYIVMNDVEADNERAYVMLRRLFATFHTAVRRLEGDAAAADEAHPLTDELARVYIEDVELMCSVALDAMFGTSRHAAWLGDAGSKSARLSDAELSAAGKDAYLPAAKLYFYISVVYFQSVFGDQDKESPDADQMSVVSCEGDSPLAVGEGGGGAARTPSERSKTPADEVLADFVTPRRRRSSVPGVLDSPRRRGSALSSSPRRGMRGGFTGLRVAGAAVGGALAVALAAAAAARRRTYSPIPRLRNPGEEASAFGQKLAAKKGLHPHSLRNLVGNLGSLASMQHTDSCASVDEPRAAGAPRVSSPSTVGKGRFTPADHEACSPDGTGGGLRSALSRTKGAAKNGMSPRSSPNASPRLTGRKRSTRAMPVEHESDSATGGDAAPVVRRTANTPPGFDGPDAAGRERVKPDAFSMSSSNGSLPVARPLLSTAASAAAKRIDERPALAKCDTFTPREIESAQATLPPREVRTPQDACLTAPHASTAKGSCASDCTAPPTAAPPSALLRKPEPAHAQLPRPVAIKRVESATPPHPARHADASPTPGDRTFMSGSEFGQTSMCTIDETLPPPGALLRSPTTVASTTAPTVLTPSFASKTSQLTTLVQVPSPNAGPMAENLPPPPPPPPPPQPVVSAGMASSISTGAFATMHDAPMQQYVLTLLDRVDTRSKAAEESVGRCVKKVKKLGKTQEEAAVEFAQLYQTMRATQQQGDAMAQRVAVMEAERAAERQEREQERIERAVERAAREAEKHAAAKARDELESLIKRLNVELDAAVEAKAKAKKAEEAPPAPPPPASQPTPPDTPAAAPVPVPVPVPAPGQPGFDLKAFQIMDLENTVLALKKDNSALQQELALFRVEMHRVKRDVAAEAEETQREVAKLRNGVKAAGDALEDMNDELQGLADLKSAAAPLLDPETPAQLHWIRDELSRVKHDSDVARHQLDNALAAVARLERAAAAPHPARPPSPLHTRPAAVPRDDVFSPFQTRYPLGLLR
eukprot:TRINITY_DN19692_c0_g1_i1.p1 TRINITY_DN19692_c0_g1~~TRINITY_DN19692_c0_g1_i1.p1  ORF type:complete len:1216 (+),score=340.47 TRINITY_DN19692_c0_g1_i1:86-3733(+)